MWPPTHAEFAEWLELARDLAVTELRGRLADYPVLRPHINRLTEAVLPRMMERAERLWRRRKRLPHYVADRLDFVRWFCLEVYLLTLRRVLLLPQVGAALTALPPGQQRLLLRLYQDQRTFVQIGTLLQRDFATVRQESRQAYNALRSQLALQLGENRDAFPLFPAAGGFVV